MSYFSPKEQNRNRRAAIIRSLLFFRLGNKCMNCGSEVHLELDCKEPRGDYHSRRLGNVSRLHFYLDEFDRLNLQLLCRSCNAAKGDREATPSPLPY
jgi:5-methylcytosine-specific restriction endonuclease McrA